MEMYDTTHPATLAQPLRWRTIEPSAVQVADPSVAPETMVDVQGMKPTYDWPVHIQTAGN